MVERVRVLSKISIFAGPLYAILIYFFLNIPFEFTLFSLFFGAISLVILNIIGFKFIVERPFLTIYLIIIFIYFYLEGILNSSNYFTEINRAILFMPYLLSAAFVPFKFNKLILLTLTQIALYLFYNYNLDSHILLQEIFIFSLIFSVFLFSNYYNHKTLKKETALQFEKNEVYQNLVKMEHQYREIYDYQGAARALIDIDGNITDINPTWENIFQNNLKIGANIKFLAPHIFNSKDQFRKLKTPENNFLVKNNTKIPSRFLKNNRVLIFTTHIWYSEKISKYFINFIDMTESAIKEKQISEKEKLAHLGLSAAGCAHDIFNPLSSIILNLDLISENGNKLINRNGPNTELIESLDLTMKAIESANAIKTLVQRLKTFTKNFNTKNDRNDLFKIIKFADEVFHLPLKESVSIEVEGDLNNLYFIEDNANNFFQVFLNFFNNSYKSYVIKGTLFKKILISITKMEKRVIVKIRDFAMGIQDQKLKNIFDLTFSENDVNSSEIGLFITKKMIENIGGNITLQSVEGVFTEACLVLPYHTQKETKNTLT